MNADGRAIRRPRRGHRVTGCLAILALAGWTVVLGGPLGLSVSAQEPEVFQEAFDLGLPARGLGLSVSFPLVLLPTGPPAASSATVFLDLIAQGDLAGDLFYRTELRIFFSLASGLRTDLTSLRESLLIAFTPSPAIFYVGGGIGVFPIEFVTTGAAGFLFSTLVRTGIEVQVAPIGLFLDVVYETMPQPFLDIQDPTHPTTPNATLVASALELSVGVLIHF